MYHKYNPILSDHILVKQIIRIIRSARFLYSDIDGEWFLLITFSIFQKDSNELAILLLKWYLIIRLIKLYEYIHHECMRLQNKAQQIHEHVL